MRKTIDDDDGVEHHWIHSGSWAPQAAGVEEYTTSPWEQVRTLHIKDHQGRCRGAKSWGPHSVTGSPPNRSDVTRGSLVALLVASKSKTDIRIWKSWQTDKCFPKCVSKLSQSCWGGPKQWFMIATKLQIWKVCCDVAETVLELPSGNVDQCCEGDLFQPDRSLGVFFIEWWDG